MSRKYALNQLNSLRKKPSAKGSATTARKESNISSALDKPNIPEVFEGNGHPPPAPATGTQEEAYQNRGTADH